MARGAAADDASRRGTHHGAGLRADHRDGGTISVRQADPSSYVGLDSMRGLQCGPSTARAHHQARQLSAAFFAGRSSASGSALRCGLETTVHAPGAAPRQRNIAKVAMARRLGVRLYWMWRKGWEYSDWVKFGSHAGQLGTGDGV